MMKPFVELGRDGRIIEWRRHLLSDAMVGRGLDALAVEPAVHPGGAFDDLLLEFTADEGGISWSWRKGRAGWDYVIGVPSDGHDQYILRKAGERPHISWHEVNYCGSVELTPYHNSGDAGATVRVERPLTLVGGEIGFEQRPGGPLRVRVPTHSGTRDLLVQLYWPDGNDGFTPVGRPFAFNGDGLAEVAANDLRKLSDGIIAVIRRGTRQRLLLHYRACKQGKLAGEVADDGERAQLGHVVQMRGGVNKAPDVGGLGAWLDLWPDRSQRLLGDLYQHALKQMSAGAAAQALRHNPAGLLRHVVLSLYNFSPGGWADQRVQQLSVGTFEEALESLSPGLPPVIKSLRSPAEIEWVMSRATQPRLSEIVEWAGGKGTAALDAAHALVGVRAKALELKSRLRPGSPEGREVAKLLADIERAPGEAGGPLQELGWRLEEVARRVQQDEQRPVHGEGEAPATEARYQVWLQEREKTSRWRRELAQVLDYCEDGELMLPDEAPPPESLEQRLRQLTAPSAPYPQGSEDGQGEEVKRLAQRLSDDAGDEPRESLRLLARGQLQEVVLPHAHVWGHLHRDILKARGLSSAYGWFTHCSGLTDARGDINERARAAETFLQLVAAAEAFAAAWTVKSQHLRWSARDRPELLTVISTPDHPWPRSAHERCAELHRLLSRSNFIQGVQPPAGPPAPPQELSAHSLNAWWEQLRNLDLIISRLEWGEKRFESSVKSLEEEMLPALGECMACWNRLPQGDRPAYFDDLTAAYDKCFGQGGAVTPSNLEALLTFLNQNQWRRDCKGAARRTLNRV